MLPGLLLAVSLRAAHELVGAGVLPALSRHLGGDALAGGFFAAFSAASALGILCGGWLADRTGPARTFAGGLAGFALGMLATASAPTMELVIGARGLEGFAAGMLSCVVSAVVMRAYDDAARSRVLALLAAAWVVPGLVAPSGAVAAAACFGWRAVFYGLVPLVALSGALALPRLLRIDRGPDAARTASSPSVLADGALRAALATRGLAVFAFFGVEAFLPLALERVRGATQLEYGALLTLSAVFWTAGAFAEARWHARIGPTASARLGTLGLTLGIAFASFALMGALPIAGALVAWSLAGLGMGIAYQAATAAAMRTSSAGSEGATSAALGITDALAIALATAVCGAFLGAAPLAHGEMPTMLLAGFALATVLGLGSLVSAAWLRAPAKSP
jgi:predicted MFS family arabinose efflux permease